MIPVAESGYNVTKHSTHPGNLGLGNALLAYDRGSIQEAQEFLDMLWHHHQLRLGLRRSGFDDIMTLGAAYVSEDDEPKA
jgi:hypothetical protein